VDDPAEQSASVALAALESALPENAYLLVALSGGPDSLALLTIAADWARQGPHRRVAAATVDHGLRPESAAEAVRCAELAAAASVPHQLLMWESEKPTTGVQAAAREARYRLLVAEARRIGATHVATAHHADDQAETVLMRLAAGSGIAGLGGMRAVTELEGCLLVRPFLNLGKAALLDICAGRNLVPIDDPSNPSQRFSRGRLRRVMPYLAKEGLTVERLVRLARRARVVDDALEAIVASRLAAVTDKHSDCVLRLRWSALVTEPEEVRLRVLGRAMEIAVPVGRSLRLEALEQMADDVHAAASTGQRLRRTLAGRLVTLTSDGMLLVGRAPPRRTG
jgi:tRNA(Ile)-lysidine synthase